MTNPLYNVPIDSNQNVPLDLLGHCGSGTMHSRRKIKSKEVEQLAVKIFHNSKKGITFKDIMTLGVPKKRAQRKLKLCCENGYFPSEKKVLFAPEKHRPQQYYPKCLRAEVNEYLSMKENVLIQPTGMTYSTFPLFNAFQLQKAKNFLDILLRLPFVHPYIHKVQLVLSIDKEYYTTLEQESRPRNKAKIYEEYIGKTLTKYTYSPNGTVEIAVRCNNSPFKLETDDDVNILFSFFGQVRDRMLYHLSDPRERVVPPIIYWRLMQCDVNKDIEITEKLQFTLPDIQLRYGGRVFREYVKLLGERAVCRAEESLKVDLSLTDGLDYIRNPNKELEKKIDYLIKLTEANNVVRVGDNKV
jgi:hypothetical protein